MKKAIRYAFYMICAAILLTQTCYAYLDPASTSYIIQIVVGIVIACGTALGIFWTKIKRVFKRKDKDNAEELPKAEGSSDGGDAGNARLITADDLLDDTDNEN